MNATVHNTTIFSFENISTNEALVLLVALDDYIKHGPYDKGYKDMATRIHDELNRACLKAKCV